MSDLTISVCKDCLEENKKKFRVKHPKESLTVGDYVKVTFKSKEGNSEGFWIRIKEIGDKIIGIIDNKPIFTFDFKLGSIVTFNYEDINDYFNQEYLEEIKSILERVN